MTDTKVCFKCGEEKPLDEFYYWENYYRNECKKCNNYTKNIVKKIKRRTPYPDEDYQCPICSRTADDIPDNPQVNRKKFVLDHCHTTDNFRGWICERCNTGLAGFRDNEDFMYKAIEYLRNANGKKER